MRAGGWGKATEAKTTVIVQSAVFASPCRPDETRFTQQHRRVAVTAFKKDGLKNHTEKKMLLPWTKITRRTKHYLLRRHLFKEGVFVGGGGGVPKNPN